MLYSLACTPMQLFCTLLRFALPALQRMQRWAFSIAGLPTLHALHGPCSCASASIAARVSGGGVRRQSKQLHAAASADCQAFCCLFVHASCSNACLLRCCTGNKAASRRLWGVLASCVTLASSNNGRSRQQTMHDACCVVALPSRMHAAPVCQLATAQRPATSTTVDAAETQECAPDPPTHATASLRPHAPPPMPLALASSCSCSMLSEPWYLHTVLATATPDALPGPKVWMVTAVTGACAPAAAGTAVALPEAPAAEALPGATLAAPSKALEGVAGRKVGLNRELQ